MIGSITSATQLSTPPVAQAVPPKQKQETETAQSKTQSSTQADTVQISKAAQAAKDAVDEATETATETDKEARSGDTQAMRLLAKEASNKSVY